MPSCFRLACCALLCSLPAQLPAEPTPQSPSASAETTDLTGTIADPSGARLAGAAIHVEGKGSTRDTTTDAAGRFSLSLPPGSYKLFVTAPGFQPFVRDTLTLTNKAPRPLAITLHIEDAREVINVQSDAQSTGAADNRSALVFKGDQLKTLSDNDATLQKQLSAMAGTDGQHAPQFFVDGFSGGQMPPKSAIREIRINQNPYSAQFEGLGFGRVEIFTKPGSDRLHAFLQVQGNDQAFNAPNPYVPNQPAYHSLFVDGNVNGPIGKKTSFFLTSNYNDQQNNAAVNAVIIDPVTLAPIANNQAVPDPMVNHDVSVRLDRQLTTNNTFTSRYEFNRVQQTNGGIGLLVLASEGFNNTVTTQTLQLGNTQVIGAHRTNETRFQYIRTRTDQTANSHDPTLVVQGSFNGGGAPSQNFQDKQDNFEFQDYFGWDHGKHYVRAGARYRLTRDSNLSRANYNGQYTFPDLTTYQRTLQGIAAGLTPPQIRANGGGATQFSITQGQPSAVILTGDVGLYADDEYKVRTNLTLNYGLRFESQSGVYDHVDPAPRVGFSWGVHQGAKSPPWVVLRGGFGLFYNRVVPSTLLTTVRQNGVSQLQYVVQQPDTYPTLPSVSALPSVQPTIYRLDPRERSAYDMAASVTADRSLGKYGSISVNYIHIRAVHYFVSTNVNAPLPGTYIPGVAGSGTRPFGNSNIYQFTSSGVGRGNLLFGNFNLTPVKWISLWGFTGVSSFKNDTNGDTSFASNSYDIGADYGRSAFDRRGRLFTGADITLPYRISLSPFLAFTSGQPFNITTGSDNNGDSIYNDRPSFATDLSRPSVVRTRFGNFDTNPLPSQGIIPMNYGQGPRFISLQVQMSKSVKFGPPLPVSADAPPPPSTPVIGGKAAAPPKPDPRYELGFSVEADNVLNHPNGALPIGVLTSPYFGRSIDLNSFFSSGTQANRTVMLRSFFRF